MKNRTRKILAALGLLSMLSTIVVAIAQINPSEDESKIQKAAFVQNPTTERFVDVIGIFPPDYDDQFSLMLQQYEQVHGTTNTKVLEYQGYRLIVPPSTQSLIHEAQRSIDEQIAAQKLYTPSDLQQRKDKAVVRRIFGTERLKYNAFIGAYVDQDGYQYVFSEGILVSKSIGVTDTLRKRWEEKHDFNNAVQLNSPLLTEEEIRTISDSVVQHAQADDREFKLKTHSSVQARDKKMALDYGDFKLLFDRSTGEILHFSRDLR